MLSLWSADNIIVGTKQYLNTWYANALLWLKRKGGPNYRVDHVFIWNLNSWDIQVRAAAGPHAAQGHVKLTV